MSTDPIRQPTDRATSVEPSRAWILGLVVEPDGTVAEPAPYVAEWPAPDGAAPERVTRTRDARQDRRMDGPTVRP